MSRKKNISVWLLLLSGITMVLFQNCNKVKMSDVDLLAAQSIENNNGELGTPLPNGQSQPPPSGTNPGAVIVPIPGQNPVPPSEEDRDWLAANCDEVEMRQLPLALSFSTSDASLQMNQIVQNTINISDKKTVKAEQIVAGIINISKTANLEIQQVKAEKINIEALEINKIQQLQVRELRVRTNKVNDTFQQIVAFDGGPRLHLQAVEANEVQQLSALCLRTQYTKKAQQITYLKVIGDSSSSKVDEIQQVQELEILDAEVGFIQQVQTLVLRNAKVKKLHQVRKLILINSTVEEMSEIDSIVEN